jgi:enoyl-CoA hydratase/carnithine racemase
MAISGPDILLYEKSDRIVTITLNRPERANALSVELMHRLLDAWRRFDEDDDAWVAVVTGAGAKVFCAGADLVELKESYEKTSRMPEWSEFYRTGTWKPLIAAINGHASSGGWALAQACDVRIASEKAEFGIAETMWNMPAGWVYGLTRQMNLGHALEVALWGDARITARRAYEMGWLNRVVAPEKVMPEAMSWAERMLSLGPRCVRNLKQILYRTFTMPAEEAEEFYHAVEASLAEMEDTAEGSRAFMERRRPVFKNR